MFERTFYRMIDSKHRDCSFLRLFGTVSPLHQAGAHYLLTWMDAKPEIFQIRPDIYAVNEEGDKPEKREFCAKHGLVYIVLKRVPREGLTRRQSTDLRGF